MKKLILLFFLSALFCCTNVYSQILPNASGIVFVRSGGFGTGSGNSWINAAAELGDALYAAHTNVSIKEVWVAAGTYKPHRYKYRPSGEDGPDPTFMVFHIPSKLKVYGGFSGGETTPADRDISANETILSGNIGAIDDSTDNCRFIVRIANADTNTLIDGFTLTEGGTIENSYSRAVISNCTFVRAQKMHNELSSLTIKNCSFNNVRCMFNFNTSLTVLNSSFIACSGYNAGALFSMNEGYTTPVTIKDCLFKNNSGINGGAIQNIISALTIYNSTFENNTATNDGGAIKSSGCNIFASSFTGNKAGNNGGAIAGNSSTISTSSFTDNKAGISGGAIQMFSLNLNNCKVLNNTCEGRNGSGGGIYFGTNGFFRIRNSVIAGNTSNGTGGGVALGLSTNMSPRTAINSVFYKNKARLKGGAICIEADSLMLYNCTFYENETGSTTRSVGAGLYIGPYRGQAWNCIFWNNTSGRPADSGRSEIWKSDSIKRFSLHYCTIQDPFSTMLYVTDGSSGYNMHEDPMFENTGDPDGADNTWATGDDGLKPGNCSPVIDRSGSGSTTTTDTLDVAGFPRIQGSSLDMGAYEAALPIPDSTLELAANSIWIKAIQKNTLTCYGNKCAGLIAAIIPNGESPLVQDVIAKVYINDSAIFYSGRPYVKRRYDILPEVNRQFATGKITLYFTQADFDEYNAVNEGMFDLPTDPADAAGIANLRVRQYHGSSESGLQGSYTGWFGDGPANIIINPHDYNIKWDSLYNRWEVIFSFYGFGGFFVNSKGGGVTDIDGQNSDELASIIVSPNPAHEILNIDNSIEKLNGKEAMIFDLQGRKIRSFIIADWQQINIGAWAPGVYIIRFPEGIVKRFIKK